MRGHESAVSEEAWAQVRRIGNADLLVGIPSYRNESTIGHVARAAVEGMARHFPGMKGVLVDSDGGSPDATRQVVADMQVPDGIEKLVLTYQGLPGKGSAFRAIFEVARALGVKACAVVDSDLRSINPEWIRLLVAPVVEEGFGYIAPFYIRYKYDGTITNSIAYPLTRALYGVSVRQPIGGDFGFSSGLLEHYLGKDVWESDVARFGIDIWMTTTAINEGFRVGQAQLGAKISRCEGPCIFPGTDVPAGRRHAVRADETVRSELEGLLRGQDSSTARPVYIAGSRAGRCHRLGHDREVQACIPRGGRILVELPIPGKPAGTAGDRVAGRRGLSFPARPLGEDGVRLCRGL